MTHSRDVVTQAAPVDGGLQADARRFLRAFGLIVAVWVSLLAATAPVVERPSVLWTGVAAAWTWAAVSFPLSRVRPWLWGIGWLVVGVGLELLGPASGTAGWSVAGGSALLVIALAALTQRRHMVVAVVVILSLAVMGRGIFVPGHTIGASLGTLVLLTFSAVSVWWLVRTVIAGELERDALRAEVARAEADRAVAEERAESAARLHDSVLQSLASVPRAATVAEAAAHAGRASSEVRAWIRARTGTDATLRRAVEDAVVDAGVGRVGFSSSGDAPVSASGQALVEASAEAVRNAVCHTEEPVRVYLEVRDQQATVWVADSGEGFDIDAIADDRLGVRNSIIGRMARVGGQAVLQSGPQGSEWQLTCAI